MTSTNVLLSYYVSYSACYIFGLVSFFLALWAGVQCSREGSSTNWIGARRLRLILVKGNALYYFAWVSSLVHHVLTDIRRILVFQAIYLVVLFTSSVRRRLSHEIPNSTTLVASIFRHYKQCLCVSIHHWWLSSHLAYSNCSRDVGF